MTIGQRKNYIWISVLSVILFLCFWYLFTAVLKIFPKTALPDPVVVFRTFIRKMTTTAPDGATLPQHIGSSLRIAMSGYLLAIIIGTPLGIMMAWYKKIDLFARPLFDLIRPVPGIAWIPLMIVLLGIGDASKIVTVFLSAFIPCVVNSYTGIKQTKEVHLWVGQTFGASNFQMLVNIAIPTSLPMIMAGAKVALGSSWTCIVAAELLASVKGLGYMIQQARGIYRPDIIISGMIAIGLIGILISWLLGKIEKMVIKGIRRE